MRVQCELLGVNRSSLYYEPVEPDAEQLALMRRMDELHLKHPFFGSRMMTQTLKAEGAFVNSKRVQRLMRLMGLESTAPKPNTNVTEHPTAEWSAQQIVDAFPWDSAPRFMLRDRDGIYGAYFKRRVAGLGIQQVLTAPRSPWQSPYVERVIGSVRRECLDHVIVLNDRHARRILREYVDYYHSCRTHLSLEKDAREPRTVHPPSMGRVTAVPKVGGLHHYYRRLAA